MNQPQIACLSEISACRPRSTTWSDSGLFTPSEADEKRISLSSAYARPNTARVHNYLLDGKDNFAPDREFAHRLLDAVPGFRAMLRANHGFVKLAARHLAARHGIRQFLVIGVGYPDQESVHKAAQRIAADARVVYIDDDPIVLAHARALLATDDRVRVVKGRLVEPDGLMGHRHTRELIDFTRPVAVVMCGGLQFVPSGDDPYGIVARIRTALPPGSWLAISHPVARPETALVTEMFRECQEDPQPGRTTEQVAAFFDRLDLEPPGLVPASRWRPGGAAVREEDAWFYAGTGRVVGRGVPH